MSESTLSLTLANIRADVSVVYGYGRTWASLVTGDAAAIADAQSKVTSAIAQGLRRFYSEHRWGFLHLNTTLTMSAPYATGTVAVALGVVTLTGGTFSSWAASGEITIDGTTYEVSTRDSDTQLTLTDLTVTIAAGETYTLSRVRYALPDNFGAIEGAFHYTSQSAGTYVIDIVSNGALLELEQYAPHITGRPQMATLRAVSFPTSGQRFEMVPWPRSDAAYILRYWYMANPDVVGTDTHYPLGGMLHAETILKSCQYAAACAIDGANGYDRRKYGEEYKEALVRSLKLESQLGPETLGVSRDRSDDQQEGGFSIDEYLRSNMGAATYVP